MDVREIDNFFRSRGVRNDCPVCGYDGVWVRVDGNANVKLLTETGQVVPTAAVICENCGFVRLHVVDVMRNVFVGPDEPLTE